jgi:NarL family two-component system sensor histidine kinase YdfH
VRQAEAREKAQSLAAELEAANRQLTQYAAQVEDLTIANERQRMARELHDTLSQGLAGIILQLEAVQAHLAMDHPEKAEKIVANTMIQARTTLAGAREAIDNLRKPSHGELDLALRSEISRFTEATGIPCSFQVDAIPAMAEETRETLIQAVTEGLHNIALHAQAHQVAVNLLVIDHHLLTTIQDDGAGFDPETVPSGHYGLIGIRERVRLVNGEFNIHSEAGTGTTIKITIPL